MSDLSDELLRGCGSGWPCSAMKGLPALAGGHYLRPTGDPLLDRAVPVSMFVESKLESGARVARRRVVVVDDWEPVTAERAAQL